jgi:uncharacterized protein with GYD domain
LSGRVVSLVKLTDQGVRNVKEWPARIQEAMQVAGERIVGGVR